MEGIFYLWQLLSGELFKQNQFAFRLLKFKTSRQKSVNFQNPKQRKDWSNTALFTAQWTLFILKKKKSSTRSTLKNNFYATIDTIAKVTVLFHRFSHGSHWSHLKSKSNLLPQVTGNPACSSLSPWSHSISSSEDTSVNRWSQSQRTSSCRAKETQKRSREEELKRQKETNQEKEPREQREQKEHNGEGEQRVLMYTS